jgi:hypothetical protein
VALAGVLVQKQEALAFIPASLVRAIRYDCTVTTYPGTELGMTLFASRIIPVLNLGDGGRALIVCDLDGELVGVSGLEPLQSGFFDGDEKGALHGQVLVPILDIQEQLEQWRATRRAQEDPWLT